MRKSYEVKIYELDGSFVQTMKASQCMNDFSFSSSINSGQSDCDIELDLPFGDSTYTEWLFAKVLCYDENNLEGVVIFTGQISKTRRTYTAGIEKINLTILGLPSLLNDVYFPNSTKNQSAGQTVKDIIDHAATLYPGWITYTTGIETWPTVSLTFENKTCIEALNMVKDATSYSFSITPQGVVNFFQTSTGTIHKLTLQKDLQSIVVDVDTEEIVNYYTLKWSGGTVIRQDSASITQYGQKELYEENTDIWDLTSAQTAANAYIAKNKVPKYKTSLVLNGSYTFSSIAFWDDTDSWNDSQYWNDWDITGIEDVQIGDLVTVKNTPYAINGLKIAKIDYNPEELKIELDDFDSFWKEFLTK